MKPLSIIGVLFAGLVIIAAIDAPPPVNLADHRLFWWPFQLISDNNRWICSGLALGLIALCLSSRSWHMPDGLGSAAALLLGIQLLIFVKDVFSVGVLAFALFAGFMLLLISTRLTADMMTSMRLTDATACWWPLVLASIGFLFVNFIQYQIDPAATMQVSDRFHGITSNPQMYALTTSIMVPALLFQYSHDRRKLSRVVILAAFCLLLFFAVRSGSRLSLLLSAISVLMYYRANFVQLASFAVPAVLLALLWVWGGEPLAGDSQSHLTSLEDTRSGVWAIQTEVLLNHPLLGQTLQPGERAGFGENSYLAAGATLGLPGLILAVGLAMVLGHKIFSLMRLERKMGWRPELALPIAILSSCLVGGFFEAFLMGIFTFPMTALLYTIFASDSVLRERFLWRVNSPGQLLTPGNERLAPGAAAVTSSPFPSAGHTKWRRWKGRLVKARTRKSNIKPMFARGER